MDKGAITERERECSKTRLFYSVSLNAGYRVDVQKVKNESECSVSGNLDRKG